MSSLFITRSTFNTLTPQRDTILVQDMEFEERKTRGGVIIMDDNMKSAGIRPRWAKVYAVGKDVLDIVTGDYVMVSHGRWSRGQNIEDATGEKVIRKVDPKDILLISDSPVNDYTITGVDY